ncbi:MAG TPA: aminotransferase class I/II-fold pyridoxal phosphate-dependent enzyme, partial [Thermoanaerobaculia bacterium]|nr:aminotransferase class I/II-fold pyridoxal phosphate-dependent enzyme [Thermoanaerobaculia bacterium]
ELITMLHTASRKSGTAAQTLVQHVAAEVLGGGVYEECLAKLREAHFERRRRFATIIRRGEFLEAEVPQGGLYFWCRLRPDWDSVSAAAAAAGQRVGFSPGHVHYCETDGVSRRIRLCFTRLSEEQISEGLGRIAQMLLTSPIPHRHSIPALQQSA